jgi:nucleoid-associated protein YgaU
MLRATGRRPVLQEEVGVIESATYDIAVSFDEEQRAVVDEVVEACRQRGLTVLEGNDLPQAQVRFFVPFVSTVDELTANGDDHVLPVLTGDAPESSGYLRADEGLVDALVSRVEAAETAGQDRVAVADVAAAIEQPPAPPATPALRALAEQFAAASPGRDLSGTLHLGDTTIAVRVERSGDTVYAVEASDETVNFVVLGGSPEVLSTLYQRIESMLTA